MGKKFRNRFRGLCPCTKTSPTPEVEDGGRVDTGRKVGVKEKQPNHPIVLSKFDQMIVEIEAMYANLIEKLDNRHKSLNEFTKVIFEGKYHLITSVQKDQSKSNTILTRGERENRCSDIINQPNTNIGHFEEKQKEYTYNVRKPLERNAISDVILYRWMTKHMEASDDIKVKMMQSTIKNADMEQTENDKERYDEVDAVLYFIDRVFIVDPRISHVSKMVKIGRKDLRSQNSINNMDSSFCVKHAKGESPFRMQIVNIPNIAMVHKVDTPCITADSFVSPHIRAQPIIFDLRKVYGIVAERNQLSGYFPTSKRVEKMGSYYPRQVALALSYLAESMQQWQISGFNGQMHLSLDVGLHAATGLQAQMFRHQQFVKILVAFSQFYPIDQQALVPRGGQAIQISTAFGQLATIGLQALVFLISVAFSKVVPTSSCIQTTVKSQMGRITLVLGYSDHFTSLVQYDENKGTEHMGQVSLPFDKCLLNTHRVQQVRGEQILQMLLALGNMTTASFQYKKYEYGDHGKISAVGHQTLGSLPAKTTRNAYLGQICVAFVNQVSTMELGLKQSLIVVDEPLLSHHSVFKGSALKGQKIHTPDISEGFLALTSRIHLADLKEEMNIFSNSGSGRAHLTVGMLTSPRTFERTKIAVTDSICFTLTNAKDKTEISEMNTAQPFRDMFGPSQKNAEFAGLGITKQPMTVGQTTDCDGSVHSMDQPESMKVLERISTPSPKASAVGVYCYYAKPAIIKKPKGKPTDGQIHGIFGIWRIKDTSAGLKNFVKGTSDKEDPSMLRQSHNIVQTNSYLKWKPTVEPTPDRLGLCRAADLIAREDEQTEKTTDIDAFSNKTPIISVRSVRIGSSTEDEMDMDTRKTARDNDESKHSECLEGDSNTSHIEADSPEGNTDCDIAKTNSRTLHRNTQDKSTDTADLPKPITPAPVVAKGPVPGSSFGRYVLKHEVKGNLQDLMDKGVPLDESHARFMCINLLDILNYLHNRGVIHTNICPSNIFFDEFGYPCLTGYDKCIYIGSDPHTRRKFRPPIEYCSPEQAMKTYVTEATDVFSVGVLCFNMIYGRPPHKGKTINETRENIVNNNFIPKFEPDGLLSKSGKFFLVSCIRKDLDKRFNVMKCGQSLVKSVKWFNDYDEKALLSHTMPSPFVRLLEN